jgi:UDP-N-acetyl-D-mannosaminuronate dehydrogenase
MRSSTAASPRTTRTGVEIEMSEPIVVVIGLGEIGKPLFERIQAAFPSAKGVDLQPVELRERVGIMHVCYPFTPDGPFVDTTVAYAAKYRPEVIVVNSTVVPGTTREINERTGVSTAYSPIRGKHTKMAADLAHYKKFVAATDPATLERTVAHFAVAGLATGTMGTPEALELAKLLETTYFGLLIAFAQEMDRFARASGASYEDIPRFFEEISYLPQHAFFPVYIGGHCVMPNIGLLKTRFESELLDGIVSSNERKAAELGDKAVAKEHGRDRARLEPKPLGGGKG